MKLLKYIENNLNQFSFIKFFSFLIIGFLLIFFLFALKDFYFFYIKKEEICRIDNVINIKNGLVCYGETSSESQNWMGNHIWEMKDKTKIDNTCEDCNIIKTNGCVHIKNNIAILSFNSLSEFFTSFYYKNLFIIKKIYEYSKS